MGDSGEFQIAEAIAYMYNECNFVLLVILHSSFYSYIYTGV